MRKTRKTRVEWRPLFTVSLCRWELLGVRCWEADQRAGVHQESGSVGVRDPGGTALGPRLQLQHLLLQVRQLLEVQPPREPTGVRLPAQHAGLERHPQQRGRCFQGHLRYGAKTQTYKRTKLRVPIWGFKKLICQLLQGFGPPRLMTDVHDENLHNF